MVATLNLYLDPELTYSWRDASIIAAKTSGHGVTYAQNFFYAPGCTIISTPKNSPCIAVEITTLDDEDFAQDI